MNSREAAQLAFGDPGFFDFLAPIAGAVKPFLKPISAIARFIPFAGPVVSTIADFADSAISSSPTIDAAINPPADEAEDDSLGNDGDY